MSTLDFTSDEVYSDFPQANNRCCNNSSVIRSGNTCLSDTGSLCLGVFDCSLWCWKTVKDRGHLYIYTDSVLIFSLFWILFIYFFYFCFLRWPFFLFNITSRSCIAVPFMFLPQFCVMLHSLSCFRLWFCLLVYYKFFDFVNLHVHLLFKKLLLFYMVWKLLLFNMVCVVNIQLNLLQISCGF